MTDSGRISGGWTVAQDPAYQPDTDEGPLSVYRRQASMDDGARVDHWFLVNSVPWAVNATVALLGDAGVRYASATDAVTGVSIALRPGGAGFAAVVPGRDGARVRAVLA